MSTTILEAVLGNAAVAAAMAGVAFIVARRANRPALAHALWLLVLIKLLTPPFFTVPLRCLPARTPSAEVSTQSIAPSPADAPSALVVIVGPTAPAVLPSQNTTAGTVASVPLSQSSEAARSAWRPLAFRTEHLPSWDRVVLVIWAAGTVLSLVISLRRVRRFGKLLRFATPAPAALVAEANVVAERMGLAAAPRVRIIPGGVAPMLWAVGRPTLIFPGGLLASLTADQRSALIAHELAHLRRWDPIVRLIELAALSIYWWCPLAWLARNELRQAEEEACDAEVLATLPGAGFDYASAILTTIDYLAGVAPAPRLASGIGDVRSLRRRLVLILKGDRPARTPYSTRAFIAAVGLPLLAIGMRFDRSSAATVTEAYWKSEARAANASEDPQPLDEAFVEPVHFLPTPTRLLSASELGDAIASAGSLSPDGRRLAIATGFVTTVWDVSNRRRIATLAGHTDVVNSVAFSPDGSRVATVSNDTRIMLWDAATGQLLHVLEGHDRWVLAATFSPDGRTLATGGYDKSVRLWDAATGRLHAVLYGHTGGVRTVAFSPDGRTLATGGADCCVRLWDVARNEGIRTLKKHQAPIRALAFSPDGTRLASGSEDCTVQLWNAADGREVGPANPVPDYVTALRFSRFSQALFVGTNGGHILHLNAGNGHVRGFIGVEPGQPGQRAHAGPVTAFGQAADGNTLLSLSRDGLLGWPAAGPPHSPRKVFVNSHTLATVAISLDGKTLAIAGQDGAIHLWDAAIARPLATLPGHSGGVTSLVFGAGGRLVSAGADERVTVWDLASKSSTRTVTCSTADLRIALSPDGCTLAIGGPKFSGVTLVDLGGGRATRRLGEWAGEVTSLAFTPGGEGIVSGHARGLVRLWDLSSAREIARCTLAPASVDGIGLSSDGGVAAIVLNASTQLGEDGETDPIHEVQFLQLRDGGLYPQGRPLVHPGPITAAAFVADGGLLTTARDGNLYLWDAATGQVVRTIRGHVQAVCGMALKSDGSAVISAGGRSAREWPLGGSGK
jgi:WD40 repeat protein/beta-lactamase regulating signal transducer with metallopeptidase domain